jgi:uncharacterized protein (DUF1330 family)
MPAYAVAKMRWTDAQGPERYLKLVQSTLKSFGGRYLAFGSTTIVEGSEAPLDLAIVEFPSVDAAKRFYESEEYRLPRKIRAVSAKTDWVVWIDGLTLDR